MIWLIWYGRIIIAVDGPFIGRRFEVISEPYIACGMELITVSDIDTGVMNELSLHDVLYSGMYNVC